MTLSTILQWPEFVNDLKNLKNQYDGPHFTHKEPEVLKSESAQSHVVFQTRLEINSGVLTWYSIWCISLLAYWLSSMVVLLFQKQGFFFSAVFNMFLQFKCACHATGAQRIFVEWIIVWMSKCVPGSEVTSLLLCGWVSSSVKQRREEWWLPWLFLSLSPVQNRDLPPAWEGRGG